jgi:heme exporter protein A
MLIASDLACERNGRMVFSGLSFDVAPGQCVELRGTNGAGKSSLLRVIAGLVPKAAGTITLDGKDDFATSLHLIAHADAMKSALTVAENLAFWAAVLGGTGIDNAMQAFRLDALRHEPAQLLSAGQRRRLALARLFLQARSLWLLDEPMTALDAASQEALRQHMRAHLTAGGMVMAATHGDLGLVPDRVITLSSA